MHRIGSEQAKALDSIHTFLPEGVLRDAPEETIYADWWKAASAESFKPSEDLVQLRASA